MIPFTVGALGCAALLGLGNGAVFKLVPERFPRDTGTVTGLVGALGGLGGFFPPLLLGMFRDRLGVLWPGFLLLSLTALLLRAANQRVFHPADVSWIAGLSADERQLGRSRARRRLGGGDDAAAGRGHRRRLAHARALRRRARRLYLRDVVCRLRDHLSLCDVDRSAADADVLAPRLAGVLLRGVGWPNVAAAGRARRRRTSPPTVSSSRDRGCAAPRTG